MTADAHQLAARYVAKHGGGTPADRRDLLDALGLIGPDGRITPAPDRDRPPSMDELTGPTLNAAIVGDSRDTGRFSDDKRRPRDLSAVPQGLRDYVAPAEATAPAPRRRRRSSVGGVA